MGFTIIWPLDLWFGYHPYGGLQLKHIEVEGLIRKLHSLHDLLHKFNNPKVIMLLFKWYQHASGILHPVVEHSPYSKNYVNGAINVGYCPWCMLKGWARGS